ncbi:hypothetical protein GCM10010106_39700 [Thermopolyspora flexuosa]|jgi:hypothetical protein|uniref:DUF5709 domain-containing protein n=2 Tax=Thermopolyspora flexuosa TaxID=103836 RepID=A0A543IU32_9ACTN|nr:hypothetical protein FHX40_0744 [Thermopolyspora flexuosa]GGM88520.1 hypothetical protein GCM10010106_39700 [Thermopolyspora flexuosa]
MPEPDPHSRFEDEGIPDLQSGTPEQQWAVDPQEEPIPADRPIAVDDFGLTAEEQREGEPLGARLAREVPEEQPMFGPDEVGGGMRLPEETGEGEEERSPWSDEIELEPGEGREDEWPAQPEEPSGAVWDEPRRAGRLVAPDEGVRGDDEPDEIAAEVGPDAGGFSAEEAAMRVEPE